MHPTLYTFCWIDLQVDWVSGTSTILSGRDGVVRGSQKKYMHFTKPVRSLDIHHQRLIMSRWPRLLTTFFLELCIYLLIFTFIYLCVGEGQRTTCDSAGPLWMLSPDLGLSEVPLRKGLIS